MKKILFVPLFILYITFSHGQTTPQDYIVEQFIDSASREVVKIVVPGKQPDILRMAALQPASGDVILAEVPGYDLSFGSSATAGAMMAGYYDRTGYSGIYNGPANGGVAPMDNSSWGSVTINGEVLPQCPISATRNGLDGRTTNGHVDDYWVSYWSQSPDPYITNGWAQHAYGECTGDYMFTNQSAKDNVDGSTTFWFFTNGSPYAGNGSNNDGLYGLSNFFQSRGYTVSNFYNQLIYGYNGNTLGFTFAQYKQEIDAGRPVLIQVTGHTMLGYGYNETDNTVYLHDTWDYSMHSMTWGGSYSGMQHYAVGVLELSYLIVSTGVVSNITQNSASCGGTVVAQGASPVTLRGVCWSNSPNPTISDNHTYNGNGMGTFISTISGLTENSTYFVRAYAINNNGISYGQEMVFTTLSGPFSIGQGYEGGIIFHVDDTGLNVLISAAVDQSTGIQWYNGNYISTGAVQTAVGAGISNTNAIVSTQGDGSYAARLCADLVLNDYDDWYLPSKDELNLLFLNKDAVGGFTANYYWSSTETDAFNAWCNWFGDGYETADSKQSPYFVRAIRSTTVPPVFNVTTINVSNLAQTSATSGGNAVCTGGTPVTARGVCWSTSANPAISDEFTIDGSGTGSYASTLAGLTANTTYYVRSYATNSGGTIYGNEVVFTTLDAWTCGTPFLIIHHTSGGVAPVNKTITYGTVTNIPGEPAKCWITSNLGSTRQATAVNDATEASAGWYWQFNRKQGFMHDGTVRTPGTAWIASNIEDIGWQSANDPCSLELGCGWRLPTKTEWNNLKATGNWTNWSGPWNSGLKLHAAGGLGPNNGMLSSRGSWGCYWSQTGGYSEYGYAIEFNIESIFMNNDISASGFPLRCLIIPDYTSAPTVTTSMVYNIGTAAAAGGGNVTSDGGAATMERGICWSSLPNPTIADSRTTDGNGLGPFSSTISGLALNTTYFVRAYATSCYGTSYGNEVTFTTLLNPVLPLVETAAITNVNLTTATSGGNVTFDGGGTILSRGVCWSSTVNPTTDDSKTNDGGGLGIFASSISGLSDSTTYYVRAYATNIAGTVYGNEVSFLTLFSCGSFTITHVVSDGIAPIDKTVTYSTIGNIPGELLKCWITGNLGADHQASAVDDATEASAGWYWQFNRKQGYMHDGVTRTPSSAWINTINENLDWQYINDPCAFELGCGWRIPTYSEWNNLDATGIWNNWESTWNSGLKLHAAGAILNTNNGSLVSRGLWGCYWSSNQWYSPESGWILAFNSSSSSTSAPSKSRGYSLRCVKNANASGSPTVTTTTISNIGQTIATSGGNVISDGGSIITARGVCWSLSQEPTIANDHTTDGYGPGVFSSTIAGLMPNTTYYVRAYADNCFEISYGSERMLTTLNPVLPVVTTTGITNLNSTSAQGGGSVTFDGGAAVTDRGVCWSLISNPTIADSKTTDGNGTGTFTSVISGFEENTTYYVRAYATNSVGTAYGNEMSFLTLSSCGSITVNHLASGGAAPVDKSVTYGTVSNMPGEPYKCWITGNLGADHQALTFNDATEPSAGWYWQFNRKQGYKHDGTNRTPNTPWISSISENTDWQSANDPCVAELGLNWRLPTETEWTNVDALGNWNDWNGPWNSGLKLHYAGYLDQNILFMRGSNGSYWSTAQSTAYTMAGSGLRFGSFYSSVSVVGKVCGFTLRCIKEGCNSNPEVSVSVSASANVVPEGTEVSFTATPTNGGTEPSFQWLKNGIPAGTNSPVYACIPVNGDLVSCVLTSNLLCVSGNPAVSNPISITVTIVQTNILENIQVPGGQTKCYNALQTILVAGNGTSYVVQSGGSATMIAGQNIIYHPGTLVHSGGYMWGSIAPDGPFCTTPARPAEFNGEMEISETTNKTSFKIYPNPTNGTFILELKNGYSDFNIQVDIYGMRGEKLLTKVLNGERKSEFSLTKMPVGIYFIRVISGDKSETAKIIKQ